MEELPNIDSALLILVMGFITFQGTRRVATCGGRIEWLIGSIILALGLTLEIFGISEFTAIQGFVLLTIGFSTCCMSLEIFLSMRKRVSARILIGTTIAIEAVHIILPEKYCYIIRALLMSMIFLWYILIFIRINRRKVAHGLLMFSLLFSFTLLLFFIRAVLGTVSILSPTLHSFEPPLLVFLTSTFASVSVVSSSAIFLTVILLEYSETYRESSERDALTGVYNRRTLDIKLNDFTLKNIHFSLVMIDLDNFKQVNDTYGHESGDRVIKLLTAHISHSIRTGDTLYRYGGEEFCVIMENTSTEFAARAIDRIRTEFTNLKILIDGKELSFSFSAGICDNDVQPYSSEEILRKADRALYQAKDQGKNRVVSAK